MEMYHVLCCDHCQRPVFGTPTVDDGVARELHEHLRARHYVVLARPHDGPSFRAVMRHFTLGATTERPATPMPEAPTRPQATPSRQQAAA